MRWTKCQMFEGKFAGMCGTSGFHVCCLFVHEDNEKNNTNYDEDIISSTPIGDESDFTEPRYIDVGIESSDEGVIESKGAHEEPRFVCIA